MIVQKKIKIGRNIYYNILNKVLYFFINKLY